ncbi:MAG: single-stranded-DNA-specific exonuclease RecJ [Holosporales bacterium]|nr:single-stranded-DNA-specific exonuclease RecJ [Holosporales bacterium]
MENDSETVTELSRTIGVPELVSNILLNRGFSDISEIKMLLDPKLRNTIPDPSLLLDMDMGIERLVRAISNNEKVMILGDYDVDGITSTYLIVKYLSDVGHSPLYRLPNRFTDGYGISEQALNEAVENGVDLIIAVDTGTSCIDEIEKTNQAGIDSIIIDHHAQVYDTLPDAVAIINPNRRDQDEIGYSHIKHLCAAGVAFIFLIALQRTLRESGFFGRGDVYIDSMPVWNEPSLLDMTGVVAIGTMCDVMELRGINRAIVKYALLNNRYPLGIRYLLQALNIPKISSVDDLGFFIGPAMNAAGRLGDPTIAMKLLFAETDDEAECIALKLVSMNGERKVLERCIVDNAVAMIEANQLFKNPGICVYGDGWHEGVIGIVAGRLKDRFHKPSFVVSFDKDGIGKGSARSIPGVHLGELLTTAKNEGLLVSGGGHSQAGGFTITKDQISCFSDFINSVVRVDYVPTLDIDYTLTPMSDIAQLSRDLSVITPFGKGIEKPLVCMEKVRIEWAKKICSGAHMMMWINGEYSAKKVKAMIFHCSAKRNILDPIEQNLGDLFDVVGYINVHEQYGPSFFVEDVRTSSP